MYGVAAPCQRIICRQIEVAAGATGTHLCRVENKTKMRDYVHMSIATPRDDAGPSADYPRPQLVRREWHSLNGTWFFSYGEELTGSGHSAEFTREIAVPFPPESPASGVGQRGFHPVVWYRRTVRSADATAAGYTQGKRLMLHFGAVDYRAEVWGGDTLLGRHEGGHTPFSFDVTELAASGQDWAVTVRAEDDPTDVGQPRGKQDWMAEPHGIWYERTTGIWQTVWLEAVPDVYVLSLAWASDVPRGTVQVDVELSRRPQTATQLAIELSYAGEFVGRAVWDATDARSTAVITLSRQSNGQAYEDLLWSPEKPRLLDATVSVERSGIVEDRVTSYLGLRSVGTSRGYFTLNDRPYFVRSVLAQGYWAESHLAAPNSEALRREVELAKELGFNAVRVHQKVEDPRFLMWADRLGLLVWEEAPSHFEFSTTAVRRLIMEWTDVILRDRSHPCIVTWVPLNESWGVQHISHDSAQLAYAQTLFHLTKALDPSRPVISNDGWEHAESDIMTIHDYAVTGPELAANYVDKAALEEILDGLGPLGRKMRLLDHDRRDQPVMVTEFGGISLATAGEDGGEQDTVEGWGYATTRSAQEFQDTISELFRALQSSPVLAGFCYTQLADTRQEVNGLADAQRRPKIAAAAIRAIVVGADVDTSAHRRPKVPAEQAHS